MNSDHVKGTIKELKGKATEEIGHATGNSKVALKGVGEQVAGKVQKAWGDARDKIKETADKAMAGKSDKKLDRRD